MSREELAASLGHRLRVEAELQDALEELDGARQAHFSAVGAGATGHDLMVAHAYLERVDRNRRQVAESLAERDAEVRERREHLAERARERQTLERLKERRRTEHTLEVQRRDAIALDELAIQRHRRKAA